MSNQRIGRCSLCGGDVIGWFGGWFSIEPPPSPVCTKCGAHPKDDTIEMMKP